MVMLSGGSAKAGLGGGDWADATDGPSTTAAMTMKLVMRMLPLSAGLSEAGHDHLMMA
jgi:hypothetical protein